MANLTDEAVARASVAVDVSQATGRAGEFVAAEVVYPAGREGLRSKVALFCLPGYGVTRRYFDLDVPERFGNYSMAAHLAAHGHVSVLVDHLGTGDSARVPRPDWLTAPALAGVHAYVHDTIVERLATGKLVPGLPPVPNAKSVGLGHSTGARVTVHQQATYRSHAALVLLGYSGRGRDPESISPAGAGSLFGPRVPDAVFAAFRRLGTDPLPQAGRAGGDQAEILQSIDVPVLCAVGDADIVGPPHQIPSDFRGSRDVTLVVVDAAGHNQNLSPNRERLWRRIMLWMQSLELDPPPPFIG